MRTKFPLRPPNVEGWDRKGIERFVRWADELGADLNDPCFNNFGGPDSKEHMKVIRFMRVLQKALREDQDGTVRS